MRLVNLQRQLRERGRIRLGYSTPSTRKAGQKVPHRSDTFIFTTPDEQTINELAAIYGGAPEQWPEGGQDKWRLITSVDSVNVILPAGMALHQAYERYRGGYPVLRCDGEQCWQPGNGKLDIQPCVCDPDHRECDLTSMLSLILSDLAGIGVFRLVTHSYYAAVELAASVDMIESAMAIGMRVPARLFLTHREVRRLIDGKPETRKFPVPVLDLNMSVAALGSGGSGGALSGGASTSTQSAPPALPQSWKPVDQGELPPAPPPDVWTVLADNNREPKRRSNAAPPVRSTGAKPRTAAEAAAATPNCSVCGLPYGTAKLVPNPEPGGSRFIHETCLDPEEGDLPADQPPPADESTHDGGGAASTGTEASTGAQPAPVVGPATDAPQGFIRMMSHAQHRKAMALCAEVWPATEGAPSGETDDMRRENLLRLCSIVGQSGLTSRTQITAATAPILLDALEAMKAGKLVMTDAGLVDTLTCEVTVPAPEAER